MKKAAKKQARDSAVQNFQSLASYRLHQLATLSERLIGMRYREKFGLRMIEVGIIILVGGAGSLSFKAAYKRTNLDKSNASRIIALLLEKGLLEKREDPADQRSFYLVLTAAGQKLYQDLYADADSRNREWIAALTPKQRGTFLQCLDLLTQQTRTLLQKRAGGNSAAPGQARSQEIDFDPEQRIVLDNDAASRLYVLLGAALGKENGQ